MISSTPGSSSAAQRPRGPQSITTRRAPAATARIAGPVTNTSPAESGRATSTRPPRRGPVARAVSFGVRAVSFGVTSAEEPLPLQDQRDRAGQVGGDGGRGGDLRGAGDRGRDQHPGGAGRAGGGHVRADVADDNAAGGDGAEGGGRGVHEGRPGLAAVTARLLVVRADLPGVDRAEQCGDAGVDAGQVLRAEKATGQT